MSRVSGKPYYLYILWSQTARRFYIGISESVDARLRQHNQGLSKWTAKFRPWELVYVQKHENYSEARNHELLLKRQKGGDGFYRLTGFQRSRFRVNDTPSGS